MQKHLTAAGEGTDEQLTFSLIYLLIYLAVP